MHLRTLQSLHANARLGRLTGPMCRGLSTDWGQSTGYAWLGSCRTLSLRRRSTRSCRTTGISHHCLLMWLATGIGSCGRSLHPQSLCRNTTAHHNGGWAVRRRTSRAASTNLLSFRGLCYLWHWCLLPYHIGLSRWGSHRPCWGSHRSRQIRGSTRPLRASACCSLQKAPLWCKQR